MKSSKFILTYLPALALACGTSSTNGPQMGSGSAAALRRPARVRAAGTYQIGALMGTPPNAKVTFDFGNGITSGIVTPPASPVSTACKCLEAYHAWNPVANFGSVTFADAGTYLMTLTLNAGTYNPLFFTFTKK
ncbi:MAG TPA: hypothetical protein VGY54_05515 [Polyangiaceae bacterium]|jgi:hypothetical protein|nr:hypothetical protein [Polyangiaceae bacterium]